MSTAAKNPRDQEGRITIYSPSFRKPVESFEFSAQENEADFRLVKTGQIGSGQKKLKAGMIIVFKDGKMAKLQRLESKTSIKHVGALSYKNPHTAQTDLVSVLAEAVVNGGEGPIKGLSHFLEKR